MEKRPRPPLLKSTTKKLLTGCGNLYVTVSFLDGQPFEVFSALGKAGGCEKAQAEAIARSISLGLRCGIKSEEYVKEFTGIQCPKAIMFPPQDRVLSCADAIAKVLKEIKLPT